MFSGLQRDVGEMAKIQVDSNEMGAGNSALKHEDRLMYVHFPQNLDIWPRHTASRWRLTWLSPHRG